MTQRRTATRFTATMVAIAAGTLLLAGCGDDTSGKAVPDANALSSAQSGAPSDESGATDSDFATDSADSAGSAGSADPADGEGSDGDEGGTDAAGSIDPAVKEFAEAMRQGVSGVSSARASMTMKSGVLTINADVIEELTDSQVGSFDMSLTMGGMEMHVIRVDDAAYLGPAETLAAIGLDTGGKSWVELSESSSSSLIAQLAGQIDQSVSASGPEQYLTMVTAATSVEKIGEEDANGVSATHYQLVIDLEKLAAAGGDAVSSALTAQQAGISEIPLDIWVDDQFRPVRVTENFEAQGQTVDLEVLMGDYDEPVSITAPDPSDVAHI